MDLRALTIDLLPTSLDALEPIPAAWFNYEFGYDGLGRRVWTQENSGDGSWFIYDGDQLVQERNFHSKALVVEYAWGPTATGGPAIFYQNRIVSGTPQERWIYTSPQGQFPRHLFDASGTITDTFQYSSFGELVFHEGTTEVGFGWMGGWQIAAETPLPLALGRSSFARVPGLAIGLGGSGSFPGPGTAWVGPGTGPGPQPPGEPLNPGGGFTPTPQPQPAEPPEGEVGPPLPPSEGPTTGPIIATGELAPSTIVYKRRTCAVISCSGFEKVEAPGCCVDENGAPCLESPLWHKCFEEKIPLTCHVTKRHHHCACLTPGEREALRRLQSAAGGFGCSMLAAGTALSPIVQALLSAVCGSLIDPNCSFQICDPGQQSCAYNRKTCGTCTFDNPADDCTGPGPGGRDCYPPSPEDCSNPFDINDLVIPGEGLSRECQSPEFTDLQSGNPRFGKPLPDWP